MEQLNFVPSEALISTIQEDLASYDSNNQLDPGRWYTWIQKIVSDLGIACYEYKHALVWIKNYKGSMPCDFQVLDSAFWVKDECCGGTAPAEGPIHYQGKSIIWDDTTTSCATQTPSCEGCDFRTCSIDENQFTQITVREYIKGLPYTYYVPILYPLAVNQRNAKGWCLPRSICFGSQSNQEITINKGEVFTNFCEGIVLFNYYAYPTDEHGLPMIPENPKVEQAIEHYIKWKVFENLYTNNDDMGVEKKMLLWKANFEQSMADAEYYMKLTSFDAMVDLVRNDRKRFNHFQLLQK